MVTLNDLATLREQHSNKVNELVSWVSGTVNPLKEKLKQLPEGSEKTEVQAELKKFMAEYVTRRTTLMKDDGKYEPLDTQYNNTRLNEIYTAELKDMQVRCAEGSLKKPQVISAPTHGSSNPLPVEEQPPDPPKPAAIQIAQRSLDSVSPLTPKKKTEGVRWKDEVDSEEPPSPSFHPSESEKSPPLSPIRNVDEKQRSSNPEIAAPLSTPPPAAPLSTPPATSSSKPPAVPSANVSFIPADKLTTSLIANEISLNKLTSKIDQLINCLASHFDDPVKGLRKILETSNDSSKEFSGRLQELGVVLVNTGDAVSNLNIGISNLPPSVNNAKVALNESKKALNELAACISGLAQKVNSEDAAKLLVKMTASTVHAAMFVLQNSLTVNQPPPSSSMEQQSRAKLLELVDCVSNYSDQINTAIENPSLWQQARSRSE